jgi:magnesium transporter
MQPTPSEDRSAEAFLGASIPTREESAEIEFSSRFYTEENAVFVTASVLAGIDRGEPHLMPLTLVVAGDRVATVRYEDFRALDQFLSRAIKPTGGCTSPPAIFLGLIEAIVDRTADVLERISIVIDRINREIFMRQTSRRDRRLALLVADIGMQGDIAAKAREALASLERLVQYAGMALPAAFTKANHGARLKLLGRDIRSLEDHITFVSNKIEFMLNAVLGMISVEQGEVIRVLTVAAMVFFPPTLIGTVYGMNFHGMPELDWPFGYPLALLLMTVSALVPLLYFRRRGWL